MAKKFQWTKDHYKAGAIVADQFSGGSTGYLGSTLAQSDLDFSGKKKAKPSTKGIGPVHPNSPERTAYKQHLNSMKNNAVNEANQKLTDGQAYIELPKKIEYNS